MNVYLKQTFIDNLQIKSAPVFGFFNQFVYFSGNRVSDYLSAISNDTISTFVTSILSDSSTVTSFIYPTRTLVEPEGDGLHDIITLSLKPLDDDADIVRYSAKGYNQGSDWGNGLNIGFVVLYAFDLYEGLDHFMSIMNSDAASQRAAILSDSVGFLMTGDDESNKELMSFTYNQIEIEVPTMLCNFDNNTFDSRLFSKSTRDRIKDLNNGMSVRHWSHSQVAGSSYLSGNKYDLLSASSGGELGRYKCANSRPLNRVGFELGISGTFSS